MTIADLLTSLRALATIPIAALILSGNAETALVVFALAAATDALDGWVARRLRATTQRGAFLDPLADKVLVVGVLAALATRGVPPVWLVALVAGREAAVTALRVVAPEPLPASAPSKLKTAAQLAAIALLLAPEGGPWSIAVAEALLVLSLGLGLRSAFTYGSRVARGPRRLAGDAG